MVDVMHADVGGEPAKDDWKIVMRTAAQCSFMDVPGLIVSPKRIFELVLHIEQPDPERSADEHDRQLHKQKRADADHANDDGCEEPNSEIRRHGTQPRLPTVAHQADRQTLL